MIEDDVQRACDVLRRLVAFDTDSRKSNLPLIEAVGDYCREHAVPFVLSHNRERTKASLLATIGPMVDGGIVLSGHTDCVPVTGQAWSSDPFTVADRDGKLFGRGTCDMKGFDAIALAMVPHFAAAPLARPIHILLSYDEEVTCLGPVELIARFGQDLPRPRAAIVGEPTMMELASAHKSVCTYRTTVTGVEAHSAKPFLGADAIGTACELVMALKTIGTQLEVRRDAEGRFDPPYSTVHVGTIAGGMARNIIAKECHFGWEFRGLPDVALDTAIVAFRAFAEATALPHLNRYVDGGRIDTVVEIEVPGLQAEPGSEAERLVMRLAQADHTTAVSYATEAGRFQSAGIPTVVCGPGSIDQAHQPDEFIAHAQIQACLAFMHRLIAEESRP